MKMLTFQLKFVSEIYLMDLGLQSPEESRGVSLNESVFDFSVDSNSFEKSGIKHSEVFND